LPKLAWQRQQWRAQCLQRIRLPQPHRQRIAAHGRSWRRWCQRCHSTSAHWCC